MKSVKSVGGKIGGITTRERVQKGFYGIGDFCQTTRDGGIGGDTKREVFFCGTM